MLARPLLGLQVFRPAIPEIDFLLQSRRDFLFHFVNVGQLARPQLLDVAGHDGLNGVTDDLVLDIPAKPVRFQPRRHRRAFLVADRAIIQIRRGSRIGELSVLTVFHKLQPLRDDLLLAVAPLAAVLDRVLQVIQHAQQFPIIQLIHQHRPPLQQLPMPLQDEIEGGVQQGVTGTQKRGHGG
ncbi:MAG: hypothetical protein MUE94_14145, partial [Verrucomicrobia bacterium]|nr:hypothetical protein [Verrucomicrobiota bacterium]